MMLTKIMSQIVPTIGATQRDVENWLSLYGNELKNHGVTTFRDTEPGVARRFSQDNTLVLGFIAAFVKAGAEPAQAVPLASAMMRNHSHGVLKDWVFCSGRDWSKSNSDNDLNNAAALRARIAAASPPILSIVNVAEVVRRVEKLFSEAD